MKCSLAVIVIILHMRNGHAFVTHNRSVHNGGGNSNGNGFKTHIYSMYPVLVVEATNAIRKSREG